MLQMVREQSIAASAGVVAMLPVLPSDQDDVLATAHTCGRATQRDTLQCKRVQFRMLLLMQPRKYGCHLAGPEPRHVSRPGQCEVPCRTHSSAGFQLTNPQQSAQQSEHCVWAFSWPWKRQQVRTVQQQPGGAKHREHVLSKLHKPPAAQQNHWKTVQPVVAAATKSAGAAAATFSATAAAAAKVTIGWLLKSGSPVLAQLLGLQLDNSAAQQAGQLQRHQEVPGPPAVQLVYPQQPQQLAGHGAAVGGGGLLAMLHETSESAAAVYTDTLKPAGELLWQLVLGIAGLLAAVVVYVLLPILRGFIRASRYLLLKLNTLLVPCRQRLQLTWSSKMGAPSAAEPASAVTSTAAADEFAMQGVAGSGSALLDACAPAVAAAPADGSSSLHALSAQHKQNLLLFTQQHLVETCSRQQHFLLDLHQLSSSSSTADISWLGWLRTAEKLSLDAGYGSCAYRATLANVPVALQLYKIATQQDAELFVQSICALCDVRLTSLMPCLGATIALVPADCCLPGVDEASSPRSVQPAAEHVPAQQQSQQPLEVVAIVAVQLMQQSSNLLASLYKASLSDRQQQRSSVAPASADAPVAGVGSVHSTSTVSSAGRIGGSSSSALTAGLQCWSYRLQLAAEVAAAVHQLHTVITAAGTNSTWLHAVTCEQLAAALVVDLAAHPMQVKLNPAVLLLGVLQCHHAHDTRFHQSVASAGLLAVVGDVLLLLATGEPHGARPSSSSSSNPTTVDQVQCIIRARLAAEGVPSDEEVVHATDQFAEIVVALWKQSSPPQQQAGQQQQQQVLGQQQESQHGASYQSTYSVAAAERLPPHTSWLGWVLGKFSTKTPQIEQSAVSSQHESTTPNSSSRLVTNATEQAGSRQTTESAASAAANQSDRACVGQGDNTGQTLNFNWTRSLQQIADKAAAWQAQQLERQQALAAAAAAAAEAAARRIRALDPPAWFICPITSGVMVDPVVAADGHTYERSAIHHWLQVARVPRSPMTNQVMQPILVPNHVIRSAIMEWKQQQSW